MLKIVIALVVLGAAAFFVLRGVNVRELIEKVMSVIRDAGPFAFFAAMAILPGLGVPVMPFHLTAGSAFGEQLGMPLIAELEHQASRRRHDLFGPIGHHPRAPVRLIEARAHGCSRIVG